MKNKFLTSSTLCWECANAIGGCLWADELKPVEGWIAQATKTDSVYSSYIVSSCPLFIRDSYANGSIRYKEGDKSAKE